MSDLESLKRYPHRKNELLKAWDSADELILGYLAEKDLRAERVLVVNDAFGALACSLDCADLSSYTDSFVGSEAARINSRGRISPLSSLDDLKGIYRWVILRIPKNLSFLEDILARLGHHLDAESEIVCGAMLKHLPKTSFDLLDRYVGRTTTSLAKKKARLIFARFERAPARSPYPRWVRLDGFDEPFLHHSNLFSGEKLDIGTRFLLENLPEGPHRDVLDLGCGNGILGIAIKQLHPESRLGFSDESRMAIESAKASYSARFADEASFAWTNSYEGGEPESLDLVLCNPPFHQGAAIGDHIAHQMFTDARRCLRPGGTMRVVGNHHLRYAAMLKRVFGNSEVVAKNAKFTIVDALRTR